MNKMFIHHASSSGGAVVGGTGPSSQAPPTSNQAQLNVGNHQAGLALITGGAGQNMAS